jgi:hypothetical protein
MSEESLSATFDEAASHVSIELPMIIYRQLERYATFGETPVDTIQRLVTSEGSRWRSDRAAGGQGNMLLYLEAGLVAVGDRVIFNQARRGLQHTVTVTERGTLELPDGDEVTGPSGVIKQITGTTDNGWTRLIHEPSGKRLSDLRAELASTKEEAC